MYTPSLELGLWKERCFAEVVWFGWAPCELWKTAFSEIEFLKMQSSLFEQIRGSSVI